MKVKFYIFFALLVFASCKKTETQLNENQASETLDDILMQKVPIFDSHNHVVKMKYIINGDRPNGISLRDGIVENEYDVDNILNNVKTPGYSWKIIEDVRNFEIQESGETRVNSFHEDLISQTNEKVELLKGPECGESISSGALASVELFIDMAENDPYLLFGGGECIKDSPYYELWLLLGTFYPDPNIISSIEDIWEESRIVGLRNATTFGAATNIDFHSVKICDLPTGQTPLSLFEEIRSEFYQDPFDSDCGTNFELYSQFSDSDWANNAEGTLFEIAILEFLFTLEAGDVVCSYYDIESEINTEYLGYRWIFSTVYGQESGWHPVSGNRQFGLYPDSDGCWVFYTAGVDRQTNFYHVIFGGETAFQEADALWDCIVDQVSEYVIAEGGTATNQVSVFCRPNINDLINSWSQYCYNPPSSEMLPPCTDCQ